MGGSKFVKSIPTERFRICLQKFNSRAVMRNLRRLRFERGRIEEGF